MKKLTLVSLGCRGYVVRVFCYLTVVNNKAFLPYSAIEDIFYTNLGFIPEVGETFQIGL